MKNFLALAILMSMYSLSSFAAVKVVKDCKTSDGQYRAVILDAEGSLVALLEDKNGAMISAFSVVSNEGTVRSTSFGRIQYVDNKTQGHRFSLAFPSTNYPHISLLVVLPDDSTVSDETLTCK